MERKWINCAKFVAIMAVLVDHTRNTLYRSNTVWTFSFYAVSLFVILSGMTSYISETRRKETYVSDFIHSGKKIFVDYCIATLIYQIAMYHYLDLALYFKYLLYFNISGPFYFVCLYLQLMLVKKILYLEIKNSSLKRDICSFAVVLTISFLTEHFTNVLGVYSGGGKILGGTYLILFFIGMIMMKYEFWQLMTDMKRYIVMLMTGGGRAFHGNISISKSRAGDCILHQK